LRASRALALVIAIIFSASLLAGLYLPRLFYGKIIIRAYAMGSSGMLFWLTNASFSVWAWAPTPNGTEFISIYNGTGPQVVIDLSRLAGWAEDWVRAYGKAAIRSLAPSIIIWVSYPIALPNGSLELVAQPYFQPLNLSLPLSGSGFITVNAVVDHPFRALVKANSEGAGVVVRGLAKVSPKQTTMTTVSTITTSTASAVCGRGVCDVWYLAPHVIKWYPNDTGMAPISLAIALAQPSNVSSGGFVNLGISITVASAYVSQFTINGLMIAGAAVDAVVDDVEVGVLFQALGQLFPQLGTTSTYRTKGEVAESNGTAAGIPTIFDDIGQLYMVGQDALVNWTEQSASGRPVAWYLSLQLTEFKAVENSGAVAPVLYDWWAYDPCVNLNEWAWEQQLLMQDPGDFYGYGVNSTCPLPNTPAPVIWQDYAKNLTYYANVSPYNMNFETYYVKFSLNGFGTPLDTVINAGSAIAWTIETLLMVSQPEIGVAIEVIGALLDAFQYQSYLVAVIANFVTIPNNLPYYVNVYFSNLTPMYTVSGQSFTLPNELVFINVTP